MVDGGRYWLGVLLVSTLPAVLPYWFLIHGWPDFWRRLGKWPTLILQFGLIFALIGVLFANRSALLGRDLGFSYWSTALAVAIYLPTVALAFARARHLKWTILTGLPEFAPDQHEPRLLTEGIYGRIRHPRYLEVILGVTAWALFINYARVFWVVGFCVVAILLIIPLEERELLARFGTPYAEYQRTVPMLLPSLRHRGP